jgi:hypothetical protein
MSDLFAHTRAATVHVPALVCKDPALVCVCNQLVLLEGRTKRVI